MRTIVCPVCQKIIYTDRKNKIYCSRACGMIIAHRRYHSHYYVPKIRTGDKCECPMCGKTHYRKDSYKKRFCLKCEEKIEKFGIEDTVSQECAVGRVHHGKRASA